MRQIDRKFHITEGGEIADSDGEVIPADEPLFLLRARDALAIALLRKYQSLGENGPLVSDGAQRHHLHKPAGEAHQETLHLLIADFIRYRREHPELVRIPQGSDSDDFSRQP